MRALLAADVSVRQFNPFKPRQFARASGVLAKNNPLDARMIASFVAIMPTRPAPWQAPAGEWLVEMRAVGGGTRHDVPAARGLKQNGSKR